MERNTNTVVVIYVPVKAVQVGTIQYERKLTTKVTESTKEDAKGKAVR